METQAISVYSAPVQVLMADVGLSQVMSTRSARHSTV